MSLTSVTDVCCRASQNSPAVNSSLFIAREALAQKQPGSGVTTAVVRPCSDKAGLGTSWHDAPLLLLLSSWASEQVATSSGWAGGVSGSGRVVPGVRLGQHLGKQPVPALARGRGCPFLTSNARHQVFLAPTCSLCFHFLCSDSPELPYLALPSRGGPGQEEATTGTQSPGLLGTPRRPAAPPGLQSHQRNHSVVRAQVVKHLPCSSTQALSCLSLAFCTL